MQEGVNMRMIVAGTSNLRLINAGWSNLRMFIVGRCYVREINVLKGQSHEIFHLNFSS
jgi:hypothetical protein